MTSDRSIYVRGLIPNDRGKAITLPDGQTVLVRGFEHAADETILTAVVSISLKHNDVVTVHD